MQRSTRNARFLFAIGVLQMIPYSIAALVGLNFGFPALVWAIGLVLFIFYALHAFNKLDDRNYISSYWEGSMVFNAMGTFFASLSAIGSIRSSGLFTWLYVLWLSLVLVHLILSIDSIKSLRKKNYAY